MRPARPGPEMRFWEQREGYKILIMTALLVICCALTYYFHAMLEMGRVFTHLFYIPIILAALWWRRTGLVVAIFLAVLLISSNIFVRAEVLTANDYLRAIMFIIIAFVVATLSETIAKAQAKTAHLNAVLRAIRNVNQLIVKEDDRDRMIESACEHLIETRGYHSAWIALVDKDRSLITAAEAGLGESFAPVVEMMKRGEFTQCGERVFEQPGIVVVEDVAAECGDCPLADTCAMMAGMTISLKSGDRVYGILSVSIPAEMAADADEQLLFNEVAGDIAFGLYRMELEDGRRQAEAELGRYRDHLEEMVEERTAELEAANYELKQEIAERKKAEARIGHLNNILRAIRNVNQLIVTEKDRDSLLRKSCDALIEARGYDAAWIGYLQDGENFVTVKCSGFAEDTSQFCEDVMSGTHPPCIRNALAQNDMFVVVDKSGACEGCPFNSECTGKEVAVIRLEHVGRLFGLLVVSLVADLTADEEEADLLKEVASDIALGLHDMEMEEARKSAEDRIKASLKEKEVLLREIHHRVKNNLQVVSSLLDLQARGASNKDTIDALTESKDRLNAMALIHAQLYEGSDLSEINMNEFVNRLLVQLLQSYPVQDTKITPIVSVADYPFPISTAVPVGLILNELLSNALKHAFVGRKEGRIEVSLTASEEGRINLTVSDNGAGLPDGFDINATRTLGLRLVKILTEDQLRGSLEVISKEGATFNMEFDTKY